MTTLYCVTRRMPVDIENRTVPFVLSTNDEDRTGDTVDQSGWRLENYLRNPVVLWSHSNNTPPIGRMLSLGVEGKSFVGRVQFASGDAHPFAETIYQLVKSDFINAGSVGFKPLRWEINDKGGLDFKEQELLEYSICGVPMNPMALRKAAELGVSLSDAAELFFESARQDAEARKTLIDEARNRSARSIATFKRAHDLRTREFQQGRR